MAAVGTKTTAVVGSELAVANTAANGPKVPRPNQSTPRRHKDRPLEVPSPAQAAPIQEDLLGSPRHCCALDKLELNGIRDGQ